MRVSSDTRARQASARSVKSGGRPSTISLIAVLGLVVLGLVTLTIVASGCGVGSEVGDAGTVSTISPTTSTVEVPTTTTALPSQTTTTTSASQPTTTVTTGSADTMTVTVYYSRGEKVCAAERTIPKTKEVGAAAMRALLQGPSAEEKAAGMVSTIPTGTTFLGLSIQDGVATVDLSKEYGSGGGSLSMMTRLAQVVFTLTQFPTVQGVNFELDGKAIDVLGGEGLILDHPMTRADYEDLSPAILVESPTVGNLEGSPVRVRGTANVFEGVLRINLVNWDGLIIADQVVNASSGTGTRGTFDATVRFSVDKTGPGTLIVFSESSKDGSHINTIEIPLTLEK